jgi:hypothetical protein
MKNLIALLISGALVVSGYSQTRNVLVGTNNAVVQPTNFWSADASNARSGLGLGSAATNPASAFQPSSSILSNLVSGGALTFSNITVGISNVTGLQSALDGKLGTNPTLAIANISNLQTTLDGKLGTNPTLQISNIAALQTALDGKLSGSFPIAISNVSGLQTSLDGKLATNPTLTISNITGLQTNLDSKLSLTGNAVNLTNFPSSLLRVDGSAASLTNFPASLLRTTGDASGLTNFPTFNQNTTGTASNVTGIVAITNGGSGENTASGARTAFGLGSAATNPASAFQPSSTVLSNLANNNGGSLTNITAANIGTVALASNITGTAPLATNITGVVALVNGGTGATNASGARTALGVSASDVFVGLTNLGTGTGQGFASTPYILGSTNSTDPNNAVLALNATGVRSVAGLTLAALTNTDNAAFRTAIGLGTAATNPATAFQPSSSVLTNLAANNGSSLTNIPVAGVVGALVTNGSAAGLTNFPASLLTTNGNGAGLTNLTAANITGTVGIASNVTGTIAISNGGSGATTAGGARTNLGLGATNDVAFGGIILRDGDALKSEAAGDGDLIISAANIVFGGAIGFNSLTNAADTRTNLGLGWTALTNTNTAAFNTSLYGSGTNPVLYNTNGEVVSPTNFWQVAPITTTFIDSQPTTNQTTNIAAGRNLHIHSIAPSTVGITNTIALPTTNSFNGDIALVVHQGPTSSVTAVRTAGAGTNLITLNQFDQAVEFVYYNSVWQFNHNLSFIEPIFFSGTNASANAAASRTNLGLGAASDVVFGSIDTERIEIQLGTNIYTYLGDDVNEFKVDSTFFNEVVMNTNLIVSGFVNFSTNHTNVAPATNNQIQKFLQIRIGTNAFFLPLYK